MANDPEKAVDPPRNEVPTVSNAQREQPPKSLSRFFKSSKPKATSEKPVTTPMSEDEEPKKKIEKWSLGILNDKRTDEVPGESPETNFKLMPWLIPIQAPFFSCPASTNATSLSVYTMRPRATPPLLCPRPSRKMRRGVRPNPRHAHLPGLAPIASPPADRYDRAFLECFPAIP